MNVGRAVGAASWLVLANSSLPPGGAGWGACRMYLRSTGLGPLLEVVQDPFHEGRFSMQAIALTAPPH